MILNPFEVIDGKVITPSNTKNYYYISTVSDIEYGFTKINDGFYRSTNDSQKNSVAICQINFVLSQQTEIEIEYFNMGVSNHSYGIIGNLNIELSKEWQNDNTLPINNTNSQTKKVTIPSGENYIQIKYQKDNNDISDDSIKDIFKFIIHADNIEEYGSNISINEIGDTFADRHITLSTTTGKGTITYRNEFSGYMTSGNKTYGEIDLTPLIGSNNFKAENIKSGVTLFGATGTYEGETKNIEPVIITGSKISSSTPSIIFNSSDIISGQFKPNTMPKCICIDFISYNATLQSQYNINTSVIFPSAHSYIVSAAIILDNNEQYKSKASVVGYYYQSASVTQQLTTTLIGQQIYDSIILDNSSITINDWENFAVSVSQLISAGTSTVTNKNFRWLYTGTTYQPTYQAIIIY